MPLVIGVATWWLRSHDCPSVQNFHFGCVVGSRSEVFGDGATDRKMGQLLTSSPGQSRGYPRVNARARCKREHCTLICLAFGGGWRKRYRELQRASKAQKRGGGAPAEPFNSQIKGWARSGPAGPPKKAGSEMTFSGLGIYGPALASLGGKRMSERARGRWKGCGSRKKKNFQPEYRFRVQSDGNEAVL